MRAEKAFPVQGLTDVSFRGPGVRDRKTVPARLERSGLAARLIGSWIEGIDLNQIFAGLQ